MTDGTIPPTSEGTVPIARGGADAPRDKTETLPGPKPDLPAVALLGPVAYAGSRMRKGISRTLGPLWGSGWNRVVIAAVLGVVVVLLGASLVRSGPDLVEVPDVRGRPYQEATDILRRAGLTTDPVSFAPSQAGRAGLVMDTIPAPGTRLEPGQNVHVIAGAATPSPEQPAVVNETEQDKGKQDDGKDEEKREDGGEEGGGRGNRESRGRDD